MSALLTFSFQTLEYPASTTAIFNNLFHRHFSLITLSQNNIATFSLTFISISGFKYSYIVNSDYFPAERSPASLRSAPFCVCVCMHVCEHCICVYACMCMCVHVRVYMHMCVCVCVLHQREYWWKKSCQYNHIDMVSPLCGFFGAL